MATTAATGTVYALIDPRNDSTRYVGATTQTLATRLNGHLNRAARRVRVWIGELQATGLRPLIVPLQENVPVDDLRSAEEAEITRIICAGGSLLNEQATARGRTLNTRRIETERVACWGRLANLAVTHLGGPLGPGELPQVGIPDPVWAFMSQRRPIKPGFPRPFPGAPSEAWSEQFRAWEEWHRSGTEAGEMLWRLTSPAWGEVLSVGSRNLGDRMKTAFSLLIDMPWTDRLEAERMLGLIPWFMIAVHPWRQLAELGALPADDASFIAWAGRDPGTREALEFLAACTDGALAKLAPLADTRPNEFASGPGHLLGTVTAAYCESEPPTLLHAAHKEMLAKLATDHMLTPPMASLLNRLDPHAVDSVFGRDVATELDRDLGLPPGMAGLVLRELVKRLDHYGVGTSVRQAADRSTQELPTVALPDYPGWHGPFIPYARVISASLVHAGFATPTDATPGDYLAAVRKLWVPSLVSADAA